MRRIFSKTRVVLLFFFLFLIFYQSPPPAFAGYTITADPEDERQPSSAKDYIYGNVHGEDRLSIVTENTKTVHIKFSGLIGNKEYKICLSSVCLLTKPPFLTLGEMAAEGMLTITDEEADNGNLTLDVCADGEYSLKLLDPGDSCEDEHGNEEGDFFWGRHIYGAVLYDPDSKIRVASASFYVYQYYPKVEVSPAKPTPNDEIIVTIKGTKRPHKRENRNNYAVEIARLDDPDTIYSQECINVPHDPVTGIGSSAVRIEKKEEGDYVIKINEQASEGGRSSDNCSAEFTYYWIIIHVRNDLSKNKGTEIIPDPNGTELEGLRSTQKAPPPPCASPFVDISGNCPKVKTGLGIDIDTSPEGFVKDIFSIILGVSGGIALLLIIYSGFQLMAARGEPEMLQAARDQLVSAIIGLIFIIFSLVILETIGVDVLRIPGFGR